jgi:hypothetical protein
VLWLAQREYLLVEFSTTERAGFATGDSHLGINVRELLSVMLAAQAWGVRWQPSSSHGATHVRCWIDNTSAVAWNNRRASRNAVAQQWLQVLALLEVHNGFYARAAHIAGAENGLADAGSRVGSSPAARLAFAHRVCGWTQVRIPARWRDVSAVWADLSSRPLSRLPPTKSTTGHGTSG